MPANIASYADLTMVHAGTKEMDPGKIPVADDPAVTSIARQREPVTQQGWPAIANDWQLSQLRKTRSIA
jgi:hypothetical protein